ncbi:hypothetical protein [Polyangium mundeleinium]|uniref:DUF4276 family protein n=1 Tax=Polyangium mundeleinium TaxID=2995306 RepID=A0ABT5EXK4_9BACT|nr:hypothetical protein [Polyangium mundeleinium]MDC0745555.1 hypothetical protein [Polyangium mundeleinium]
MKKSQRRRLHVLCEDRLTVDFVERLADRWGMGPRQRSIDTSPKARGSGEQYVREHFAKAVARWRAQSDENVVLLVVVDGDNKGVARRRNELEQTLREAGATRIAASDPVAIIVPTWHIETWIAWLCGHRPVSELQRYKNDEPLGREVANKIKAGEYTPKLAVAAWTHPAPDEATHVPSLTDARDELTRRLGV